VKSHSQYGKQITHMSQNPLAAIGNAVVDAITSASRKVLSLTAPVLTSADHL
jgi:hypothetical protein